MGTPGAGGGGGGLLFRGGTSFPLSFWFTLEMFFVGAPGGIGNLWGACALSRVVTSHLNFGSS